MKDDFFRTVHVFDGVCDDGEGELLFSFKSSPVDRQNDGYQEVLTLDVRERDTICVKATTYKVSHFCDGQNMKLIVERPNNNKEPLVFVKPSPRSGWVLVQDEGEKLISHGGNHSLNMLYSEFAVHTAQEY